MNNQKIRIDYFDNLKGILIILVVFAHCLYGSQQYDTINFITDVIYVFHMPAFIFLSGYLSKSSHSREKNSLMKLFSAYLIFNTVMMLYDTAVNSSDISLIYPYYSCWYLLAMIVWRAVSERFSKIKGALAWSILAALAAGFFSELSNVFAVSRIISFYPFFLAGFLLPQGKIPVKNSGTALKIKGVLLVITALLLSSLFIMKNNISDSMLLMYPYDDYMGVFFRLTIFSISAIFILGICLCVPDKKIAFITKTGKNSLSVFLLHRIITLLADELTPFRSDIPVICTSIVLTVLICLLTGADKTAQLTNNIICSFMSSFFHRSDNKKSLITKITAITSASVLLYTPVRSVLTDIRTEEAEEITSAVLPDSIYTQLSADELSHFENDFRILFAGDLILLEDQVKRAWDGEDYSFDDVFEYTSDYISAADLAIGVFEGPTAGEEAGYSTSNFDDGKTLFLNYPDEFASAVKNAGFDLVTTANNHLLDKGLGGALRTLDVLDEAGLEHIGSYRNTEEKETVKIIEQDGIKLAFLAYTYGTNGYQEDQLLDENMSFITSLTVDPESENIAAVREQIKSDFDKALSEEPDAVIVLSHMGTQFENYPDDYQLFWNDLFLEFGADMILNDHTHSVQPVELSVRNGKAAITVNCPGNFANIYREYNGDASAMVEIYLDRESKNITGAAVIPMWTECSLSGNYRALPIYDILNNEELQKEISTYDLERIDEVQKHITGIMTGSEIPCSSAEKKYYITTEGYKAQPSDTISLSEAAENSPLYKKLSSAESVCFVGDSITHGTKNGGFGWYRPLEPLLKNVSETAAGGATTKSILSSVTADYQLYVTAIGTNDVRYRDESICAMSSDEYITELEAFVRRIRSENPDAEFAFIAPWTSLENDTVSVLNASEKYRLTDEYTEKLREWCSKNGHIFSDPNTDINAVLEKEVQTDYLVDHIHPNRYKGIMLYCKAVLENSVSFE